MKITMVVSPWYRRESPPPDVAMAAAIMKKDGHIVKVLDINNIMFKDKLKTRSYWKYFIVDYNEKSLMEFHKKTEPFFNYYADEIIATSPDAVVFQITGHTLYNALKLAKTLKEKKMQKPIIFSGWHYQDRSDIEKQILDQQRMPYDYAIFGEYEAALPILLHNLEKGGNMPLKRTGKIIDCSDGPIIKDMNDLPFFDFSVFDLNSYKHTDRLEMFSSRGCPRKCAFCLDWKVEGKYKTMNGKRIFEEVKYQYSFNKIRHITFCDKMINGNMKTLEEFIDHMHNWFSTDKNIRLVWTGDMMVRKELTEKLLNKMSKSGFGGVGYGIESGSDKVLKDIGKQFDVALAERVIRDTHNAGIHTAINIMVGFPTETNDDFNKTLNFIERNKMFINEIRISHLGCMVYKHSDLEKYPEKYNINDTDMMYWNTKDGSNNYDERIKRYKLITKHVLRLGIPLRVNSRMTKTGVVKTQSRKKTANKVISDNINIKKVLHSPVDQENEKILEKAKILKDQLNFNEAIELADEILKKYPQNIEALILTAEINYRIKNMQNAEERLRRVLEVDSRNTWAWRIMGEICNVQKRYTEAEEYFSKAFEKDKLHDNALIYAGLCKLYINTGCKEKAIENIEKALRCEPENDYFQALQKYVEKMEPYEHL